MEFYPHQQQQQQQQQQQNQKLQPQQQEQQQPQHTLQQLQQVDDGSISGPATITSTINSNNNNNNNNNNKSNNNINRSSSSTNINTPPTSTTATVAADAATVAIAKDMLQLHHGNAALNSTNNNNNNSNNSSNSNNSNNNNNSALEAMNTANVNSVASAAAAGSSTAAASPLATTVTTVNTHPPAHASELSAASSPDVITAPENALGYLKYDQELLYITETCTIIGRNSSTSHVHFHVAENNLVSRKHFQVLYDSATRDFYVQCLSKNGIFVDDFLQRRNADPLKLPTSCYFRFPSTEMRIRFESFMNSGNNAALNNSATSGTSTTYHNNNHHAVGVHNSGSGSGAAHVIISPAPPDDHPHAAHSQTHMSHHHQQQQQHSSSNTVSSSTHLLPHMDNSNVYSPLKISIPKKEQKSPYLSPTGTISAANSCPASPRQGFHQNQSSYNNYGNNNIQNQDLFQTPSTASYNHNEKPPYSYAQLIVQAISAAPDKQLTLSGIYSFIVKHYPYYRKETNKGWQNSIRHNLSLNRYFIKVARSQDEPGKGSFWRIDPDSGAKLIDHSYKKRRQRSSQGFRPSYGMPRSAPVSPSHMDNSRESSPIPDYILQSAPGSPGMSLENRATDGDLMYNTQNMHQSAANNSHNQYNSSGSPYFVSNQNAASGLGGAQQQQQQLHNESGGGGNSSGNGVGVLISLKRNHVMAAGAAAASGAMGSQQQPQQQQSQQQPQSLHPDIIYEDMPTDYSGNMESGDECDAAKRPKYLSEVL